jgi:hypothetical protein
MNIEQTIANTVEAARKSLGSYGRDGSPWRYAIKIVNGHHVQANLFGWGEGTLKVWVDKSTEPLTVAEAAARVSVAR